MRPVTGIAYKQIPEQTVGISFRQDTPSDSILISRIAPDGLFASSPLHVGMKVLNVNSISVEGRTSTWAIQLIKETVGEVMVVAENHVVMAQAVQVTPVTTSTESTHKLGYIILKKTFKARDFSSNEKSYSFHGPMTHDMISVINEKLQKLKLVKGANLLQFHLDHHGHFYGAMNHLSQKVHEEDFVVIILEAMEILGWHFRFQYDAEFIPVNGYNATRKEMFIFHRMQK